MRRRRSCTMIELLTLLAMKDSFIDILLVKLDRVVFFVLGLGLGPGKVNDCYP